jgi:hypothetical protein
VQLVFEPLLEAMLLLLRSLLLLSPLSKYERRDLHLNWLIFVLQLDLLLAWLLLRLHLL